MSTTPPPLPASATTAPPMSKLDSILNDILTYSEIVTEVAVAIPQTSAAAAMALKFEQIAQAAIQAQAASSGQTVAQVVAQLHQITPVA